MIYTHTNFFFFNDTATTEIYTLSLHDALPILAHDDRRRPTHAAPAHVDRHAAAYRAARLPHERSEEHTSELQSHSDLVCRLLLEKNNIRCGRARHATIVHEVEGRRTGVDVKLG